MKDTLRKFKSSRRNNHGSGSMAEFGPALGLLLICFFFPLLDLITLSVSYGLIMVLNYNQVHEASLVKASEAQDSNGAVKKSIPDQWQNGMGHFVKMSGDPNTDVSYRAGQPGSDNITDQIVRVQTTVVCQPFLPIPLPLVNVPGLNGPMTFSVCAEREMENPDYVNE